MAVSKHKAATTRYTARNRVAIDRNYGMEPLSADEQGTVAAFFAALDDHGVDYVVLRKYEGLPSAAPDDIDVFVEPSAFDRAVDVAESLGFGPEWTPESAAPSSPIQAVLRNLQKAPRFALGLPALVVKRLRQPPAQPTDVKVVHRQFGAVRLDMANHLRYPEWNGTRVPDHVERQMLDERERYGDVYVPAPADRPAHVVAHCLADYHGRFPPYYVDLIDGLVASFDSDPEARARFERLLEALYGDDATAISDWVRRKEYERLGQRYSKLYRRPTLVQSLAAQVGLGPVFAR
jgi:hypothetical protein